MSTADAVLNTDDLARLSNMDATPTQKTLLLLNNFITNTVDFMNKFAAQCERKLSRVSLQTQKLEVVLALLEAKLESIPWIDQNATASGTSASSAPSAHAPASSLPPPPPSAGSSSLPPPPPSAGTGLPPPPPSTSGASLPPPPTSTAVVPAAPPVTAVVPTVKAKDDPRYSKYFKLLRYGVSVEAAKRKLTMESDGKLDPSVLDMDPEGPAPPPSADGDVTILDNKVDLMSELASRALVAVSDDED